MNKALKGYSKARFNRKWKWILHKRFMRRWALSSVFAAASAQCSSIVSTTATTPIDRANKVKALMGLTVNVMNSANVAMDKYK